MHFFEGYTIFPYLFLSDRDNVSNIEQIRRQVLQYVSSDSLHMQGGPDVYNLMADYIFQYANHLFG